MFYGRASAFWILVVLTLLTPPANGQAVISTRSGIINFFEGSVYLGDEPVQASPGRFASVPKGVELRTAEGRAEVLLTPGVFLRIGEKTTIRMVANELSDTRVEVLTGSAIVDAAEPNSGTSVTLIYRNWGIHFLEPGVYRIDSNPPRLCVFQGKAEVSTNDNKVALSVGHGMYLPFAEVLVPERLPDQPRDALSTWAEGRQQSISADNAIAANIQDPASMNSSNSGFDNFTNYPMLGLPSLGPILSSTYSSLPTYQPGFYSTYLPGYTYLPLFVGLVVGGFPTPLGIPPHPAGWPFSPPRSPAPHPIPVHPVSSPHPIPSQPVSRVGVHVGGHR